MIGTLSTSGKKCLELGKTQDLIPGTVLEPSLTRINIDSLRSLLLAKKRKEKKKPIEIQCFTHLANHSLSYYWQSNLKITTESEPLNHNSEEKRIC